MLAKDFVAHCDIQARQAEPTIRLNEQVLELEALPDGLIRLGTTKGERWSRTVIVCAGVGAFEPKRLTVPGLRELEGKGVHYFAKRVEDFRDKQVVIVGGGDSAVDWAVTLEPVAAQVTLIHRSKFRAHEATVRQLEESTVDLNYPGCEITAIHEGDDGRLAAITFKNASGDERTVPADDLIVAIGFVADLGPMKTWGFELQRNQIVVDKTTMETGIPGVYAAGDVVTYPAKFKLIVTGAAEAVTAVNHAVTYYDPKARLDPGHSTNIMEKREKAEAGSGCRGLIGDSGDRKLLDDGAGELQPSVVGVVRHRAPVGQDEFAAARLRQRVPCLGFDLLLRPIVTRPRTRSSRP